MSDYRTWVGLKTLNYIARLDQTSQLVFLYGRCLCKDSAFPPDAERIARVSGLREQIVRKHYGRLRRAGFWTSQWLTEGTHLTEVSYAVVSVLMLNTMRELKLSTSDILFVVRLLTLVDGEGCVRQFPDQIARRLGIKYSDVLRTLTRLEAKKVFACGWVATFLRRPVTERKKE